MTTITIPFQLNFEEIGEHLLNKDVVSQINSIFAEYGAVLLRGFPLKTAEDCADVAAQFITTPMDYMGGTIARQPVKGLVYNSSEFPPAITFPIHNEMGYTDNPPKRILFFCLEKAEVGGQTPICDCRRVLQRLPNQLVDAIRTHGVRYIRNLPKESASYLKGWSQAFKTENTRIAEERCKAMGFNCTWEGDMMVITNTVEGIRRHPYTGKELWVNQITSYHSSRNEHSLRITPQEFFGDLVASVNSDKMDASPILRFIARASSPLLLKLGSKMLPVLLFFQKWYAPNNINWKCTLGNGTPFTRKDIEAIWDAVIAETIVFNWQQGDVLLLDQKSRPEFGPVAEKFKSENTEQIVEIFAFNAVKGYRVKIGGLFSLGPSFGVDGNLIVSDSTFLRIFQNNRTSEMIDIGVIILDSGAAPQKILLNIQTNLANDVLIFTKQEFQDFEKKYWATRTPIGFIFNLMLVMCFIIGIVIVYQILYSNISTQITAYATLKAIGYTNKYLLNVVFKQALILAVFGYIPGFIISSYIYSFTAKTTNLPMRMSLNNILIILILTILMSTVSGLLAMNKLRSADPADIF